MPPGSERSRDDAEGEESLETSQDFVRLRPLRPIRAGREVAIFSMAAVGFGLAIASSGGYMPVLPEYCRGKLGML